jgi:hypothetical protein
MVHEFMEIGSRPLGPSDSQTLGDLFYRKCRPLTQTGGHTIPNWDFEVVQDPKPGQYRYHQFAWRGTAQTRSATLRLSGSSDETLDLYAGEAPTHADANARKVADGVPTDWRVVRVDLWDPFHQQPVRIQGLSLICSGSAAWFDQIVLGRAESDLPVKK